MSIATFESPEVATQQFFPWVFDDEADCGHADTLPVQEFTTAKEAASPAFVTPVVVPSTTTSANVETRLGKPVRLGAVMIKLLNSYGITDEEIAEGMAAYAAQSVLAQAG